MRVWVDMLDPREDGLSSNDEAPTLHEIEEHLVRTLGEMCDARFAGRITGNNRREFYFYAPAHADLEEAVLSTSREYPNYSIEYGHQHDPDWRQYLELLYPSAEDWQRISNRRVIEQLAEHGDDASIPRLVDHMAYFPSAESPQAFAARAIALGFALDSAEFDEDPRTEPPYSLVLKREDPVTWDHIDKVTLELAEIAESLGGDYHGWGCQVQSRGHTHH
jgi:regulator of RNase E activity RraB